MVMYFQDDFWEAISKLKSNEDQDAAIVALVRYHFDRSEPSNPIADAILTVCKDRIELSQKRSKAGATKKSKANQNKIKTESKSDQSGSTASLSYSLSNSNSVVNSESEIFDEVESDEPSFSVQCLKVFNDITGWDMPNMPQKATECLNLRSDRYTLEQVGGMVKMKREQWEGTKIERNLKPSTLFSPDHFDEYMQEYLHQNDEREFSDDEIPY